MDLNVDRIGHRFVAPTFEEKGNTMSYRSHVATAFRSTMRSDDNCI